jgi:hypothetical protein
MREAVRVRIPRSLDRFDHAVRALAETPKVLLALACSTLFHRVGNRHFAHDGHMGVERGAVSFYMILFKFST